MTNKRLHRDEETALIAGVLGGLANYFNQDPTLFRLAAVFFIVITGVFPGLLIYMLAWFVVPRKPKADYTIVE
jgi:phage shock protein PspC (stress-responsive transcriptional regulator)